MAKKRSESRSEVVLLVPELHEFSRWRNHCQSLYKLSLKLICCRSKTKGLPQESPKLEGPSAEVREVCRLFGEDRHLYSLSLLFFYFFAVNSQNEKVCRSSLSSKPNQTHPVKSQSGISPLPWSPLKMSLDIGCETRSTQSFIGPLHVSIAIYIYSCI